MLFAGALGGLGWAVWPMLATEIAAGRPPDPSRSTAPLEVQGRAPAPADAAPSRGVRARFTLCHAGGGANCVVDGDTFWMSGIKVRIADIDTPETHPARCPREAELGEAATRRLHALLNSGAVSLAPVDRDSDRYGRKLRLVSVDGRGVGDTLIAEGLARSYAGGYRDGWCG